MNIVTIFLVFLLLASLFCYFTLGSVVFAFTSGWATGVLVEYIAYLRYR